VQMVVTTRDRRIKEILEAQGVKYRFIDCISYSYTGPQRKYCSDIELPPLISRRKPALFIPTPRGLRYPRPEDGITTITPWGTSAPGYTIPIARYGLLRSVCTPMIVKGTIMLICYGEPDRKYLCRILRVAKTYLVPVKVVSTRLYNVDTIKFYAEMVQRRRKLLLFPYGLPHLIMAGIRYAVEEYGEEFRELASKLVILYDADVRSRERNIVKNAVDYMCHSGDEVACYASKYYHIPVWHRILRYAEIRGEEQ